MGTRLVVSLMLLLLLPATAARADPTAPEIVRVYSSFCYHNESGDVLGERVIVFRLPEGDYVLYENSGDIYQKLEETGRLPKILRAKIGPNDTDLEFMVPSASRKGESYPFNGKLTATELVGRFRYARGKLGDPLRLPRVTDWSHGFKDCANGE